MLLPVCPFQAMSPLEVADVVPLITAWPPGVYCPLELITAAPNIRHCPASPSVTGPAIMELTAVKYP